MKLFEPKKEIIEVYEGRGISMGVDLDSTEKIGECCWIFNGNELNITNSRFIHQ